MSETTRKPLWRKILIGGFAAVIVTGLATGGVALWSQYESAQRAIVEEAASEKAFVLADLELRRQTAAAAALALAVAPGLPELMRARDRPTILATFGPALAPLRSHSGLQLVSFFDRQAKTVARLHKPDKFDDDVSGRRRMVVDALKGAVVESGIEIGLSGLTVYGTAPIVQDGAPVGVVDSGTILAGDYFRGLEKRFGARIVLHTPDKDKFAIQYASQKDASFLDDPQTVAALAGSLAIRTVEAEGRTYVVQGLPIANYAGRPAAVMEIAADVTRFAEARSQSVRVLALATGLLLLIALAVFYPFARSLGRAASALADRMSELARGEFEGEIAGQQREDEIGVMARSLEVFRQAGRERVKLAEEASAARRLIEAERQSNEASRQIAAA